jgi:hypothetical protein
VSSDPPSSPRNLVLELPAMSDAEVDRIADRVAEKIRAAPLYDTPGQLLTIQEYAKRKGVSESTIKRMCKEGLPVEVVGQRKKVDATKADAWLAKRGSKPTTPAVAARKDDVDVTSVLDRGGLRPVGGRRP